MKQVHFNRSITKAMLMCLVIGLGVAVTGLALLALSIGKEMLNPSAANTAVLIIRTAGAAAGVLFFARFIKEKKIIWCMLFGAVYCLILLSINALFFDGVYEGVIVDSIVIIVVCALVGLTANKHKSKMKYKNFKM